MGRNSHRKLMKCHEKLSLMKKHGAEKKGKGKRRRKGKLRTGRKRKWETHTGNIRGLIQFRTFSSKNLCANSATVAVDISPCPWCLSKTFIRGFGLGGIGGGRCFGPTRKIVSACCHCPLVQLNSPSISTVQYYPGSTMLTETVSPWVEYIRNFRVYYSQRLILALGRLLVSSKKMMHFSLPRQSGILFSPYFSQWVQENFLPFFLLALFPLILLFTPWIQSNSRPHIHFISHISSLSHPVSVGKEPREFHPIRLFYFPLFHTTTTLQHSHKTLDSLVLWRRREDGVMIRATADADEKTCKTHVWLYGPIESNQNKWYLRARKRRGHEHGHVLYYLTTFGNSVRRLTKKDKERPQLTHESRQGQDDLRFPWVGCSLPSLPRKNFHWNFSTS